MRSSQYLQGGDESTFTDRLAQPELEGYHPYMGYEAETPGCARSLSTYFECSALKHGPAGRQTATDVRERFFEFSGKTRGYLQGQGQWWRRRGIITEFELCQSSAEQKPRDVVSRKSRKKTRVLLSKKASSNYYGCNNGGVIIVIIIIIDSTAAFDNIKGDIFSTPNY